MQVMQVQVAYLILYARVVFAVLVRPRMCVNVRVVSSIVMYMAVAAVAVSLKVVVCVLLVILVLEGI